MYAVALVLMVLIGYGGISMAATANATIQLAVPDQLRGRVMSVYTTIFAQLRPDRRAADGRHRVRLRAGRRDRHRRGPVRPRRAAAAALASWPASVGSGGWTA